MERVSVFEKKPSELLSKWTEEQLSLLKRGQRLYGEMTQAALDIVKDSLEMRVPDVSMKKFVGSMLELGNVPLNGIPGNGHWKEYSRELQKLLSGAPFAVNGTGFSKEATVYGKATWENGSKATTACVNFMKHMFREQKFTTDTDEAGRIVCDCLDAAESFIGETVACLLDQVKAGSAFVKSSLLKEKKPAAPVQA
ncbi:MAG: hypothetical protein HPY67_04535 [Syntrophaceae bacterium]|nr:hypothetical protein [Syntrophaceae bacterium]